MSAILGNGLIYGAGFSESARLTGKTVYVVGGANSGGQAAMQFSRFADCVVMLVRGSDLSATMSDYLSSRITQSEKISVRFNAEVPALAGDDALREITVKDKLSGALETMSAAELFVCVGGRPNAEWARDLPILRDSLGYLLTGSDPYQDGRPSEMWPLKRQPCFLETTMPGSFAAGDARHDSAKRYATAVGEGGMAVKFVNHIFENGE